MLYFLIHLRNCRLTYVLFLGLLNDCEKYHNVSPIDKGQHGLQLIFLHNSPGGTEVYEHSLNHVLPDDIPNTGSGFFVPTAVS